MRFTPPELASELARRLLRQLPADEPPAVLDPACGDGALLLAALREGAGRGLRPERVFGLEIDPELVERARQRVRLVLGAPLGETVSRNIRLADALDEGTRWPRAAVIANPPWVSFSGRQARSRRAGLEGAGWPSLHGAFLERIARHVGSCQTAGAVLLPASVCEGEAYGPLRRRTTRTSRLAAPPLELGEDSFPGVVEPAVLLELLGSPAGEGSEAPWYPGGDAVEAADWESFPRLPPECFRDPGVHTGNSAADLVARAGEDIGSELPGLREGKDLSAYRLAAPRLRLRPNLERTSERRFRIGRLERYRGIPVLIRQTADRPIAALHTEPTYFRNTLLACTPPPELDPAFVVGVLNSRAITDWHQRSFRDARQRTFPQVKVAHLRALPFPFQRREENPEAHDRIARQARQIQLGGGSVEELAPEIDRWVRKAFGFRP